MAMTKERQQAIRDEREAEERYTQQGYQAEHVHRLLHEIGEKLDHLLKHQQHMEKHIMANLQDVNASIDKLRTAIVDEKADVQAKLEAEQAKVKELQAIIDAGGVVTSEQLGEVVTRLEGITEDVRNISEPAPAP